MRVAQRVLGRTLLSPSLLSRQPGDLASKRERACSLQPAQNSGCPFWADASTAPATADCATMRDEYPLDSLPAEGSPLDGPASLSGRAA
jgi:hypothetical protein